MANQPSSPSKIGQLRELCEAALRESNMLNTQVQDLIENDWGEIEHELMIALTKAVELILSRRRQGVVQHLIDEADLDWKYVGLPFDQFPLDEESLDNVSEEYIGESITVRDLQTRLTNDGLRFASPLTALRYAIRPDQQRKYPLVVIFEIDGLLWCLVLGGDDAERKLHVFRVYPERRFGELCRFLVVGKSED